MRSEIPGCDDDLIVDSDELLKLENQLCFALYVSSREIIKGYKPLLDPLGLTYTAYITLLALWEKDKVPVRELGKRLHLDSGTLTPLLKKMEARGLVKRERSRQDERVVIITLTEQGHELKETAREIPRKLICASGFDPRGGAELLKMLHRYMNRGLTSP